MGGGLGHRTLFFHRSCCYFSLMSCVKTNASYQIISFSCLSLAFFHVCHQLSAWCCLPFLLLFSPFFFISSLFFPLPLYIYLITATSRLNEKKKRCLGARTLMLSLLHIYNTIPFSYRHDFFPPFVWNCIVFYSHAGDTISMLISCFPPPLLDVSWFY